MEPNPLFYKSVVPLNRDRHRDWMVVDSEDRYAFARGTHVIPAVVDEFAAALAHLPIVFAPSKPYPTTVFLVGVRPSRNLLVGDDGRWKGGYIPAFLRRYPFMRGEVAGGNAVTCIDERSELLGRSTGQRLFDADGKETPLLTSTIDLVDKYFVAARRTDAFLAAIHELQLLRQVTIETSVGQASSSVIHGFMTVDEQRLAALGADALLRLRDGGFLAPIYAHLFSLRSVDLLRKVLVEAAGEVGIDGTQGPVDGDAGDVGSARADDAAREPGQREAAASRSAALDAAANS